MKVRPEGPGHLYATLKDLQDGPIETRSCTDIPCLLIFICNIIIIIVFAILGYIHGTPAQLFATTDADGRVCGTGDLKDYPFAYLSYPLPTVNSLTSIDIAKNRTCVSSCPGNTNLTKNVDCLPNSVVTTCQPSFIVTSNQDQIPTAIVTNNFSSDVGAFPTVTNRSNILILYPTQPFLYHFCNIDPAFKKPFQNQKELLKDTFSLVFQTSSVMDWARDIYHTYSIMIAMIGIGLLMSIIYLICLRYIPQATIMLSILLVLAAIPALGYCLWQRGEYLMVNGNQRLGYNYKASAVVLWCLSGVYLIFIGYYYRKISIGTKFIDFIMEELFKDCSLVVLSLTFVVVESLLMAWWVMSCIYILSSAPIDSSQNGIFTTIQDYSSPQIGMFIYFVIGGVWCILFINAFYRFVVGAVASISYFEIGPGYTNDQRFGHSPVNTALYWAFRYHIGSLALGGLFTPFTHTFRIIVQFIQFYLPHFCECCTSCINCITCPLRLLAQNFNNLGYIHLALGGKDVMESSQQALETLWHKPKRVVFFSYVGETLIVFGELMIGCTVTIIFYFIITRTSYGNGVYGCAGPCVIVFVLAITVANRVLTLVATYLNAFFQCFFIQKQICEFQARPLRAGPVFVDIYARLVQNQD